MEGGTGVSILSLRQRLRSWLGWDDRPRDRLRKLREREIGADVEAV